MSNAVLPPPETLQPLGRWNSGKHDMVVREGRRIYAMCAVDSGNRIKIGTVNRLDRLAPRTKEVARSRLCPVILLGSVELPKCDGQAEQHFEFAVRFWLTQHCFRLTDDFDWLLPTSTREFDWPALLKEAVDASIHFVRWGVQGK